MPATSLTLDTPAQATPNAAITLTGTYVGSPQALDYNFGSGWVAAPSPSFSSGSFAFTVPAGIAAGSYTPQVRDHSATSVGSTATAWTPQTLSTSPGAAAVFEFNPNDPASAAGGSSASVQIVADSLNRALWLTAKSAATAASGGNPVVIADGSGADGTRRVLQFHATHISPNSYDPATEWLTAGGVNGTAGTALVNLADSSSLAGKGAFTTIIALNLDTAYSYAAGPIWGAPGSPGGLPLQYVQIRSNIVSGVQGSSLTDSNLAAVNARGTITAGWHVLTMIKGGGQLSYRLDGQTIQTMAITSNAAFTASDFMIGGGFAPPVGVSPTQENGVPPPDIGEFQAYNGVLAGSDLVRAEALAGSSIGRSFTSTVPQSIALSAPGTVQEAAPGAGVTVSETVSAPGLGTIYEEVLTAGGAVETGFQAVTLDTGGKGSFSVHLARSGDYLVAQDRLANPGVVARSAAVTIIDPVAPPPAGPVVSVAKPGSLVAGQDSFSGTVTSGSPGIVKFAWHASATGETASAGDMVVAARQADGSYGATLTIDHIGQTGYFYVAVDGVVTNEWNAVPVAVPSTTPTISLSAPGTVQEASVGAGVTVTETIGTTNLTGSVYAEVLTASGAVETGYQAIALSNGHATAQVHLSRSGDTVRVVDNTAVPTVTANSAPVTITDPGVTPLPGGPATVSVAKPATLVAGQDSFSGVVTGGTPGVVKFAWHASATGEAASAGDMVTAAKQADGSYAATLNIDHVGQIGYFYVAVDGVVTDEWNAVPVMASAGASATPAFIASANAGFITSANAGSPSPMAAALQHVVQGSQASIARDMSTAAAGAAPFGVVIQPGPVHPAGALSFLSPQPALLILPTDHVARV